jgi:hypothetical protein
MNAPTWLEKLEWLVVRFSHLGVTADMASMTMIELWALYRFLSGLAGKAEP